MVLHTLWQLERQNIDHTMKSLNASHVWIYRWVVSYIPDSKIHVANMERTLGQQDQGGPHVGHMNFVIWDIMLMEQKTDSVRTELGRNKWWASVCRYVHFNSYFEA